MALKGHGAIFGHNTRNLFSKGHVQYLSTDVPYFGSQFLYSCPIRCPLFSTPNLVYVEIETMNFKFDFRSKECTIKRLVEAQDYFNPKPNPVFI